MPNPWRAELAIEAYKVPGGSGPSGVDDEAIAGAATGLTSCK